MDHRYWQAEWAIRELEWNTQCTFPEHWQGRRHTAVLLPVQQDNDPDGTAGGIAVAVDDLLDNRGGPAFVGRRLHPRR